LWKFTHVAFTWWVAIGTFSTFSLGYLISLCTARAQNL
jgi:hypothetical protein